ncbi:AcrR family transcriptional regulator [Anaerotaenia torta]|uniref:TetR/AcrR family transcriptional regulator n=1 Tax=Anaerotaenia torta TaxID=433293 RepID=UPI003D1BE128
MELKEKLMDAVIEAFNEKGLKFTMDDIAKHMGISKRTLYTVVEDKEALFLETMETVFGEIKKGEREILEDESLDSIEKLKRILIFLPNRYQAVDFRQLYELKDKYPRIYAKLEKRLETDWDATFQIMEQAMEEGRIRRINLQIFRAVFSGTVEYYLSRRILEENRIEYEDALRQMLDILMEGIRSRE